MSFTVKYPRKKYTKDLNKKIHFLKYCWMSTLNLAPI